MCHWEYFEIQNCIVCVVCVIVLCKSVLCLCNQTRVTDVGFKLLKPHYSALNTRIPYISILSGSCYVL